LERGCGWAAFFSIFEIFLAKTPAFVWVYSWWGALPVFITVYVPFFLVFITVYVPFFLVALYSHDWKPRTQWTVIGALFAVNALALIVFAGVLGWI
jgi:hypothetical protein